MLPRSFGHALPLLCMGLVLCACPPRPSAQLEALETPATDPVGVDTPDEHEKDTGPRWVDLSIEQEFGCAVERSGAVFCWGRDPAAQMQLRELPERARVEPQPVPDGRAAGPPSRVEMIHDARAVSTATTRACAIVEDGRVRCWGAVRWGSQHVYDVAGIHGAVDLEISDGESCVLLEDQTLSCWGAEDFGIPQHRLEGVVAMSMGENLACALDRHGALSCWGQAIADWHRYDQQLNQGQAPSQALIQPGTGSDAPAEAFPDTLEVGRFPNATDLRLTGWNNLCVLRGDAQLACSERDVSSLLREPGLELRPIADAANLTRLSTARTHGCAQTRDQRARCWGRNVYGQLGDGSSSPREGAVEVSGLEGVVQLDVAEDRSCAATRAGEIWCWGFDRSGPTDTTPPSHTIHQLGASSIAASGHTTCAVDGHDALRCWGGTNLDSIGIAGLAEARDLGLALDGEIRGLLAGWESCVHGGKDQLHCGSWTGGAFVPSTTLAGIRDFAGAPSPVCTISGGRKAVLACGRDLASREDIGALKRPTAVSAANMRACAVHGGGRVSCFAELYRWDAQMPPPRDIVDLGFRDVVDVASSTYQDCVLHKSGKLSCWVARTQTEWSSDGRTPLANHYEPGPPRDMGLARVEQLVAGGQTHCARTRDGVVRCWLDNPYAEDVAWQALPELPDDDPVVELAAGSEHVCARHASGDVTCWGQDTLGQLGRLPAQVQLQARRLEVP